MITIESFEVRFDEIDRNVLAVLSVGTSAHF